MSYSRSDLLKILHNAKKSPLDIDYRVQIEKYILIHYNLMAEELVDPKKYRSYCSVMASKVKQYYTEASEHFDRMLNGKHKVNILGGPFEKCIKSD